MREQVAHLHTELARRYAGKPQPAAEREQAAAEQGAFAVAGLWEQYSAPLEPLPKATSNCRASRPSHCSAACTSASSGDRLRTRAPVAAGNAVAGAARLLPAGGDARLRGDGELLPTNCSDSAVGISCHSTYCDALLLGLADRCPLSVRQIELIDRLAGPVGAQGVPVRRAARDRRSGNVDGPRFVGRRLAFVLGACESVDIDALRLSGQARHQRARPIEAGFLPAGANPAELQLGHEVSVESSVTLLNHVDIHWYQLPKTDACPISRSCN